MASSVAADASDRTAILDGFGNTQVVVPSERTRSGRHIASAKVVTARGDAHDFGPRS